MRNFKKSQLVIATSFLAVFGLSGCNSNQSAQTPESDDTGLVSMKKDKQQQNVGADQAAVYSTRGSEFEGEQQTEEFVSANMEEMSPISQTVTFEFDSAELTPEAKDALRSALNDSQRSVPMEAEIVGYTDDQGPESYNERLSEKRAQSVKEFISNLDVNVNEWEVEGRGEASPTAPNDSRSGRAENRRVSVTLRPMEQHSQQGGV